MGIVSRLFRKLHVPRRSRRRVYQLGFDAVEDAGRRQKPSTRLKSDDAELTATKRKKLVNATRDLRRNFTVAGWMIRQHIKWCANVTFQSRNAAILGTRTPAARTELERLDERIEELVAWWSRPLNFDAAGRHGLQRATLLGEASRLLDGDILLAKLNDAHVQLIAGDRIRTPTMGGGLPKGYKKTDFVHGVKTNGRGKAEAYCICKRGGDGQTFKYERIIPARHAVLHAWWQNPDGQTRGISPFAPAINTLRDAYEGATYALLKMKISQMFGLALYRDADEPPTETDETAAAAEPEDAAYTVDWGKGPFQLDLEPDDKAEFLESQSPPTQFQSYWQTSIAAALKALDLPYSFWDEAHTNFFGSRAALLNYLQSAELRRDEVRESLDNLLRWRLALFVADGELTLPRSIVIPQLRHEWIARGQPWWNPVQEVKADLMAIKGGLRTHSDVLRLQGKDFHETIARLAEERKVIMDRLGFDPFAPKPAAGPGVGAFERQLEAEPDAQPDGHLIGEPIDAIRE